MVNFDAATKEIGGTRNIGPRNDLNSLHTFIGNASGKFCRYCGERRTSAIHSGGYNSLQTQYLGRLQWVKNLPNTVSRAGNKSLAKELSAVVKKTRKAIEEHDWLVAERGLRDLESFN